MHDHFQSLQIEWALTKHPGRPAMPQRSSTLPTPFPPMVWKRFAYAANTV